LFEYLIGVAVDHVPNRNRPDQIVFGQDTPRLFGYFSDSCLKLTLTVVDATSRCHPPPGVGHTGIAVLEEQCPITVNENDPYRRPAFARPISRIRDRDVAALSLGRRHSSHPTITSDGKRVACGNTRLG
jgi:hypothetical protein